MQAALKDFLEEKLGAENIDTPEKVARIIEKKEAAILRAAPKEAVEELKTLLALIKDERQAPISKEKQDKIAQGLEKIQKMLQKKMKGNSIAIMSTLLMVIALTLFTVGTAGAGPFLLVVLGMAVRIAGQLYEDRKKIT